MKIVFVRRWRNQVPGEVAELPDDAADDLISKGIAIKSDDGESETEAEEENDAS